MMNMKRKFAVVLALMLLVCSVASGATYTSNTLNLKHLIKVVAQLPVEQLPEAEPEVTEPAAEETKVEETVADAVEEVTEEVTEAPEVTEPEVTEEAAEKVTEKVTKPATEEKTEEKEVKNEAAKIEVVETEEPAEEKKASSWADIVKEAEAVAAEATEEVEEAEVDEFENADNDEVISTLEDALDPNRHINIHIRYNGDAIHMGDKVQLKAELVGYDNLLYNLQWQVCEDGETWTNIEGETELTYTFIVTLDNYDDAWAIVVDIYDTVEGIAAEAK